MNGPKACHQGSYPHKYAGDSLPPVAIGGVGGSGTRLVASLLGAAGAHLGDDLNPANDNLWFTLLFKRIEILGCDDSEFDLLVSTLVAGLRGGKQLSAETLHFVATLAREDRPQHSSSWLQERIESLQAAAARPHRDQRWGWKEPNTHIVIERLWQHLPQLRYVHVVRNGIDMAYSSNQNQLRLWGPHVLGEDGPATPGRSLAYWRKVHQRMQRLLADNSQRMYWLDYDALCQEPFVEVTKLCRFLDCSSEKMTSTLEQVHPPSERDAIDLADFDPSHLDYARSLGYAVG